MLAQLECRDRQIEFWSYNLPVSFIPKSYINQYEHESYLSLVIISRFKSVLSLTKSGNRFNQIILSHFFHQLRCSGHFLSNVAMISVRPKIDWSVNFFRSIHIWFVVFGENMPSMSGIKVDCVPQAIDFSKIVLDILWSRGFFQIIVVCTYKHIAKISLMGSNPRVCKYLKKNTGIVWLLPSSNTWICYNLDFFGKIVFQCYFSFECIPIDYPLPFS